MNTDGCGPLRILRPRYGAGGERNGCCEEKRLRASSQRHRYSGAAFASSSPHQSQSLITLAEYGTTVEWLRRKRNKRAAAGAVVTL